MKKKLSILKRKNKAAKKHDAASTRITNETVAEHRERILAGGRRFKYPHQYVRHQLVRNAVIIGMITVVVVVALGWQQLYLAQNTSQFAYRVTRAIPVPVASVDGQMVRYSDYLMRYRSQEMYLRNQGQLGLTGTDEKQQLDYQKRKVLDGLEKDMYAEKKAKEMNISVSDAEIQTVIGQQRNTISGQISQPVYDDSIEHLFGYKPDEYRHILKQSLLQQKVAFALDAMANRTKQAVAGKIASNKPENTLESIVKSLKSQSVLLDFGSSGLVPKGNKDGGLSQVAVKLKDGEISKAVESTTGDGYYFVQRVSANGREVSYNYIRIPLTEFDKEMTQVKQDGKISEYISLKENAATPTNKK